MSGSSSCTLALLFNNSCSSKMMHSVELCESCGKRAKHICSKSHQEIMHDTQNRSHPSSSNFRVISPALPLMFFLPTLDFRERNWIIVKRASGNDRCHPWYTIISFPEMSFHFSPLQLFIHREIPTFIFLPYELPLNFILIYLIIFQHSAWAYPLCSDRTEMK